MARYIKEYRAGFFIAYIALTLFVIAEILLIVNGGIRFAIQGPIMAAVITVLFMVFFGGALIEALEEYIILIFTLLPAIIYGIYFYIGWSSVTEGPNLVKTLLNSIAAGTQQEQREAISRFPLLSDIGKEKAIEFIKDNSVVKTSIETQTWKLIYADSSATLGEFLGQITSQTDTSLLRRWVIDAVMQIDDEASWKHAGIGRPLYNSLKSFGARTVPILGDEVIESAHRTKILVLAQKLGIVGSEEVLISSLLKYGNRQMAEDYLNVGNERLADAARRWAESHGYSILYVKGSPKIEWGKF